MSTWHGENWQLIEPERPGLLTDLLRRVDAVTADAVPVGVTLSARHERELQVHDLPLSTAPTAPGVREALRDGRRSLHVAVDHSLLDLRAHPELSRLPVLVPAQEDPAAPAETFRPTGRALSAGTAELNGLVRLTRTTLRVEGMRGNGWHYDYHSDDDVETVDLTRLLARWTGPRGRLWLIDRAGREVSVPLRALTRRKEFLQALAPSLRGVPTMTVRHPRRVRTFSGTLLPLLGSLIPCGTVALVFGIIGVLVYR